MRFFLSSLLRACEGLCLQKGSCDVREAHCHAQAFKCLPKPKFLEHVENSCILSTKSGSRYELELISL